jgi:hypothetical protein
MPCRATASIAAFAHEVSLYKSVADFDAAQTHFASKSFIPSGMFKPGGEPTGPPEAHALFAGHIVTAEAKRNDLTGREFQWALVETLGGRFDVVIDPEILDDVPRAGGVLRGAFWLSGRLTDYPRRSAGFFRRLFRR